MYLQNDYDEAYSSAEDMSCWTNTILMVSYNVYDFAIVSGCGDHPMQITERPLNHMDNRCSYEELWHHSNTCYPKAMWNNLHFWHLSLELVFTKYKTMLYLLKTHGFRQNDSVLNKNINILWITICVITIRMTLEDVTKTYYIHEKHVIVQ